MVDLGRLIRLILQINSVVGDTDRNEHDSRILADTPLNQRDSNAAGCRRRHSHHGIADDHNLARSRREDGTTLESSRNIRDKQPTPDNSIEAEQVAARTPQPLRTGSREQKQRMLTSSLDQSSA
jgi:hypothetical protein